MPAAAAEGKPATKTPFVRVTDEEIVNREMDWATLYDSVRLL